MRKKFRRLISLFLSTCILVSSAFCFMSCKEQKSAHALMLDFCNAYGIEKTVFSPSVAEGSEGYANADFFEHVFGEKAESVSDYAVVFSSGLDRVQECAVLLCYSDYDALVACDILRRRVDLVKSMGASINTSYAADAVVFKSGKYAVMCVLSDNERAEKIWRKIL